MWYSVHLVTVCLVTAATLLVTPLNTRIFCRSWYSESVSVGYYTP